MTVSKKSIMACDRCKIGYMEVLRTFEDRQKCLEVLKNHGVIPLQIKCKECHEFAKLNENNSQWLCPNGHSFERSERFNDWLEDIHISPGKRCIMMAIYLQTNPPHEDLIVQELNISRKLVDDWSCFIRDVIQDWCLRHSRTVGGPSTIIEIDEAKVVKSKYYSGYSENDKWVFSGVDKRRGNIFFETVPNRTSSALIQVIERRVRHGTNIVLDSRMVYECLHREGLDHLKTRYNVSFIDPNTGEYTFDIVGEMPEIDRPDYCKSYYLADFLFRKHFPDHHDRIHHFLMALKAFPLENRTSRDNNVDNDDDDTQMASIVFFITCFIYAFIASYFFYKLLLKYHLYPLFT